MNESHEAIKIERDLTLNISPGSVADLLPDNLIRGSGDFRDTTVVVLRHADEEEDQSSQTLMLSSEGERQIDSTVGQLVDCLNNAGEPITLKFYSSPKEYAKITAGRIIKELEELQLEGKLSEGVRLLKATEVTPRPRERSKVTIDIDVAKEDAISILNERNKRRTGGEEIEFSTILIERDEQGTLSPETEGRQSVINRLMTEIHKLQRVNERISPEGEKILLFIVTHNVYFEALLGRKAEGCEGIRIDLPVKSGQKLIAVGKEDSQEIDF